MEGYEVEEESVEEEKRRLDIAGGKCVEWRKQRLVTATYWLYIPEKRLRVIRKDSFDGEM